MRNEQEVNRAIEQYADTVRRLCMLYLKNHADTEDIFQTVFLKYVLSSVSFENGEHEKAWFIRVTINACKDLLKSFFRSRTVSLDEAVERPDLILPDHIVFLLTGGNWLYFTPTAEISIDINPSISLTVNRFDRVIAVEGVNDDGKKLASSLDIRFTNYMDAVSRIIENREIAILLLDNEILTVSVIGPESKQCSRMCGNIASTAAGQKNIYCYFADTNEAQEARELGLPYGKYKAFLELGELDSKISPDEVRGMTMRQLRDLIGALSGEPQEKETGTGQGCGRGRRKENCWKVQENNGGNNDQEQR